MIVDDETRKMETIKFKEDANPEYIKVAFADAVKAAEKQNTPYRCNTCDTPFTSATNLAKHELTPPKTCQKASSSKSSPSKTSPAKTETPDPDAAQVVALDAVRVKIDEEDDSQAAAKETKKAAAAAKADKADKAAAKADKADKAAAKAAAKADKAAAKADKKEAAQATQVVEATETSPAAAEDGNESD